MTSLSEIFTLQKTLLLDLGTEKGLSLSTCLERERDYYLDILLYYNLQEHLLCPGKRKHYHVWTMQRCSLCVPKYHCIVMTEQLKGNEGAIETEKKERKKRFLGSTPLSFISVTKV